MGVKIVFFVLFVVGVLYFWNVKWNLLKNNLFVKYSMYYVSEALMALLFFVGVYCVYF